MEYSEDAIPFLDILIKRKSTHININQLIQVASFFPLITLAIAKKNISFTLARHICTIVENPKIKI